ncbi:hypothetical protein [Delftia sp. DT-2]|uniref:hypothetical protein n=1 Tax=Delftia sp. DT-2 TaxID=3022772 RepID=UPI00233F4BB0|nr:hypothetical protein [Delftia sp. DT-2]MDC2859078.1 hypothetical protein [Delftia sp. DT-2]
MQITAQVLGGPLNGRTIHTEYLTTLRATADDGGEMDYQLHRLAAPKGSEQAVYIYAPRGWTPEQINSEILKSFPSKNAANRAR